MKRIFLPALAVTLAALATQGSAQTSGPVITRPDWAALPRPDDVARFMPRTATDPGQALIECRVTAKGLLENCTVISETPPGAGYGEAAVKMASVFKMKPTTLDGAPVAGGTVRVPIRFQGMPPMPADQTPDNKTN